MSVCLEFLLIGAFVTVSVAQIDSVFEAGK